MDDLTGLSFDAAPPKPRPNYSIPQYPAQLPSPSPSGSRQPSPLSAAQSGASLRSSSVPKPNANDSFSNLISPTPVKGSTSLSLQERQKQLLEEKSRQAAEKQRSDSAQYNPSDAQFWEDLGSGKSTPAPQTVSSASQPQSNTKGSTVPTEDDDILAAFNSSAPVDSSSHFPPQHRTESLSPWPAADSSQPRNPSPLSFTHNSDARNGSDDFLNDDDPFGLGQVQQTAQQDVRQAPPKPPEDDYDILGDLAKPVDATMRNVKAASETAPSNGGSDTTAVRSNAFDRAIAELVEMGFPVERARQALESTGAGDNLQAAVGWLLNQAHEESRAKSRSRDTGPDQYRGRRTEQTNETESNGHLAGDSARMKPGQPEPRARQSQSPSEGDFTQYAATISSSFFKSANTLWKTGQKRVQKVMADFQQDGEGSQPRWMREPQDSERPESRRTSAGPQPSDFTDEAMLLEGARSKPHPPPPRREKPASAPPPRRPQPSLVQPPAPRAPPPRPVDRVNRQAIDEQSSQAYISPARRKKPPPPPKESEPTLDIFSPSEESTASVARATQSLPQRDRAATSKPSPALATRQPVASRQIPAVSSAALASSSAARQKGTEAFKRGDYADAYSHYTSAIAPLPSTHPLAVVLFCNRALTNIKTGDPKAAISDAETALAAIGPSRGEDEAISFGDGEPDKPMKEFFGKALMRKAEALEHMEKWAEAAKVWREAVEAGVGGSLSIQGRNRCEKAIGISSTPARPVSAPAKKSAPAPRRPAPAISSLTELNGAAGGDSEAVKRLREANAAAVAASDEAFALTDSVDARLVAWKTGKEGNLRALLASLDTVLWEGAGWVKVGMGDLVLPNRVKIVYMKAIAKCHPDKLSPTATTEQRMISASVFATLNEAWDKFKLDNGL